MTESTAVAAAAEAAANERAQSTQQTYTRENGACLRYDGEKKACAHPKGGFS